MIKLKEYTNKSHSKISFEIRNSYGDDVKKCLLHFGIARWAWYFEIPTLFKPVAKQRVTDYGNYIEYIPRAYGFSIVDDMIHTHYGIQPGYWSSDDKKNSDRTKLFYIPWKRLEMVRHSLYNLDGTAFAHMPSHIILDWEERKRLCEEVPKIKFSFNDYDGEEIIATCYIEEREWRYGKGIWRWLLSYKKPIIWRVLDLNFSKEVGHEKGSWKGGTLGHSVNILPNETPLDAFTRYGNEKERRKHHGEVSRTFTNIKVIDD